ncbi:hypothetical protein PLESTB_000092600 [Pleodorina starrii]|uniref:Uncharacterized protein n=1 Tax=Pleodorina starrii TaxID=330485 RepID=A0A9W6BAV5_9CHLO|nr:hypothetical protein PLESTM_000089200 [Pleodorina starrii]GLC48395.1 hypothetical protein PLESTB_000092600 [Pleodorina starrii]GLC71716.1 hypothetical protein PLESTF_001158300 [Pleodorina starrii]
MSGAQSSRCASLLKQFSRCATESASCSIAQSGAATPSHAAQLPWARLLDATAHSSSASSFGSVVGLGSMLRCAAASVSGRACATPTFAALRGFATKAASGAGGRAATAEGAGLLARAQGGAASMAAASASSTTAAAAAARSRVPQGMLLAAGILSKRAGVAAAHALRKGYATAAAAEGAAAGATAVRRQLYGGSALSEGLSSGARLALAGWLGLCSVWVYSMVVLGGITRLTRSGLSMTEWKLAGERPPRTDAEWEAEFTKYKASPEYQKVHRGMTLDEFKFIYWMEYAHRMWGRFLGLAFALPAAFFLAKGWVNGALGRRLGLLFFMGGTQGLVGWWMVRSGLEEPEHEWAAPRVSPYRLAAHLVSAFAIYATLVWTTLDLLYPRPATLGAAEGVLQSTAAARRVLLPLAALIAITATSGAFVAGMDAGRAYNTYPLMNGQLVPEEYWDERLGLTPLRNLFENTAAVQFNHRCLATLTLLAVGASWLRYRGGSVLPGRATSSLHAVAAITAAQFALGIYTLLQYVPVALGSAHQANALNLFTAALALLHACRPPAPPAAGSLAAAAAPLVTPAAVAAVGVIGYVVATQNGTLTQSNAYTGPSSVAAAAAAK